MLFHVLVSHSAHLHPERTNVLRGPPAAPWGQMRFLLLRKGPTAALPSQAREHCRLETEEAFCQIQGCVAKYVGPHLEHSRGVSFIAEPLLLHR